MKKKILFLVLGIIVLVFSVWLLVKDRQTFSDEEFEQYIKDITSNAKIIDANSDHHQALDVINYAHSQGVNTGKILINFDTHSDMYKNWKVLASETEICNWINEVLAKYPEMGEVYWVMPKDEANNKYMAYFFALQDISEPVFYGNAVKNLDSFKFVKTPVSKQAYEQDFLIDPETGNFNEYAPNEVYREIGLKFDSTNPNYRHVKVVTCTEDTLPDFEGKEVFLSIDADYLSNSGFDTGGWYVNNKNKKQIKNELFSLVKTIKDKNIRAEVINLTLSPQYLPDDDHEQVLEFFDKVFKISQKQDVIKEYTHHIDAEALEFYEDFKRHPIKYLWTH